MTARPTLYGEEFETLIQNHGITCDYEPAIVCDCLSEDSGQPLYTCKKCGGRGYRYLRPKRIKVVVTSFASKSEPEIVSLRESGTAYATPPAGVIMGYRDRLTFPDFRCKYSERIWVKPGETVSSKTFRTISETLAVVYDDIEFEEGADFTISEDRRHLIFTSPLDGFSEREDGKIPVSILYYTTPSYLVSDIIHELRSHYTTRKVPKETFEELPKQYRISREWFKYEIEEDTAKEVDEPYREIQPGSSLFD